MKRRLLLTGPIGCGKSTLIANALGGAIRHAGGFLTLRVIEHGRLAGFDLAPACGGRGSAFELRRGRRREGRAALRGDGPGTAQGGAEEKIRRPGRDRRL
ncbi:MAG: nucleoside-triphosphatase [Oscillospiraceae bacterium]